MQLHRVAVLIANGSDRTQASGSSKVSAAPSTTSYCLVENCGGVGAVGEQHAGVDEQCASRFARGAIAAEGCIAITSLRVTAASGNTAQQNRNRPFAVGGDRPRVDQRDITGVTAGPSARTKIDGAAVDARGDSTATTTNTAGHHPDRAHPKGFDVAGIVDGDIPSIAAIAATGTEADGPSRAAHVTTATADGHRQDADAINAGCGDPACGVVGDRDIAAVATTSAASTQGNIHGGGAGE